VTPSPARGRNRDGQSRRNVINYHHVIHALKAQNPQALWSRILPRNQPVPPTEIRPRQWQVIAADLPKGGRLPPMSDLLFIALVQACEGGTGASAGSRPRRRSVPEPKAWCCWLAPKGHSNCQGMLLSAHLPSLDSFRCSPWGQSALTARGIETSTPSPAMLRTAALASFPQALGRDCQPAPTTTRRLASRPFPCRSGGIELAERDHAPHQGI